MEGGRKAYMFPPWLARLWSRAAAEGPTPPSASQFSSYSGTEFRKLLENTFLADRSHNLSVGLPELQAVAGLGVLQLGVLVVPEGGPLCGLLSLESVDPPVERTVGQVIVYSSLQ